MMTAKRRFVILGGSHVIAVLFAAAAAGADAQPAPPSAPPPIVVAPPVITPAPPPALSTPAQSDAKPSGKNYVALTLPQVLLPPAEPIAPGTERVLQPGDTLFSARTGFLLAATLDQDMTLAIAGKDATLPKGTILVRSFAGGGDIRTLPKGRSIYCADPQYDAGRGIASLLTLGLSNLGTRLSKTTQFCFVDTDSDKRLDRAFLVGTKRPEDRVTVEVQPTGYTAQFNMPTPGDAAVSFVYRGQRLLAGPLFELRYSGAAGNIASIRHVGEKGKLATTKSTVGIKFDKLPQTITLATAKVTVLSIDPETRAARVRVDQDIRLTPFSLTYTPQTIYVYVPR
jgi:hypothetical protein